MYHFSFVMWASYIILVGLGLFIRRSKIYDIAVIVFIGLLAFLNTDAADLHDIYMPVYANPNLYIETMDPGWLFLCRIGRVLGLSYYGFSFIIAIAAMTLIAVFARKTTPNESFFLSMFLVYPGLISLVQFRQFAASAVAAVAILVLSRGGKRGWIGFTILILLAFSIHRSALILATPVILLIYKKMGSNLKTLAVSLAIFFAVLFFANAQQFGNHFFGEYRTSVYLGYVSGGSKQNSLMGGIRNVVYTIGMCVLIPYLTKLVINNGCEEKEGTFLELVSFSNIIMVLLVPFMFITNDFMRFERYAFTLALCIFTWMPYISKRHPFFSTKALLLLICFAFCYSMVIKGTFDSVFQALLSFEYIPPFFL